MRPFTVLGRSANLLAKINFKVCDMISIASHLNDSRNQSGGRELQRPVLSAPDQPPPSSRVVIEWPWFPLFDLSPRFLKILVRLTFWLRVIGDHHERACRDLFYRAQSGWPVWSSHLRRMIFKRVQSCGDTSISHWRDCLSLFREVCLISISKCLSFFCGIFSCQLSFYSWR